ncbi:hypothetical protein HUU62_13425 [Rhodoferax sp. 4810]|uniref:ApeI dehydratase-like domain-containing protein n=2 Tax=Thiospirillum jenense TaxID=1653858 RepID=A0A839HIT6_9GAMM|nr:hypothetical protein [Rhodoferax jenense]MBB1126788.1 hypothetical protein [Thiospirillum jenense]
MMTRTEQVFIPVHHPSFAGHFPHYPIVPGALLLELIGMAWGQPMTAVPRVKFLQPVLPGDELMIQFTAGATQTAVQFICQRGAVLVCTGLLQYAD